MMTMCKMVGHRLWVTSDMNAPARLGSHLLFQLHQFQVVDRRNNRSITRMQARVHRLEAALLLSLRSRA